MGITVAEEEIIIVLDCGSTNLRAIAVDRYGHIISQHSHHNSTTEQPGNPEWRIWNLDEIWDKLSRSMREVTSDLPRSRIAGVIVATWGVDGAPVRRGGTLAYPVISWQCDRMAQVVEEVTEQMDSWEMYRISGNQTMAMNTLFKLIWLRKNAPEALEGGNRWMMMPGLIESRLGADMHIDPTSASTTMIMDMSRREWSSKLLSLANLTPEFLPELRTPGEIAGEVSRKASENTGLPEGLPILVGGHDTQFAILASGASTREAALSSGTWEILALRTGEFRPTKSGFNGGMIWEVDVMEGIWDPQVLMMGSAVLEWVKKAFYPELPDGSYQKLIEEGSEQPPGSSGVTVIPSFVEDSGPTQHHNTKGTVLGLDLHTDRSALYRASVEGLCFQLRQALDIIIDSTGVKPKRIRVVGGGSKNRLWNQIRADVTGVPLVVGSYSEGTVLGAALTGFTGLGIYSTIEEGLEAVDIKHQVFHPSENSGIYDKLYERYRELPLALENFYTQKQDKDRC